MGKIYTSLFSDTGPGMPSTPASGVKASITVATASKTVTRVSFFSEGKLAQLAVKQVSGPLVPFTVELLSSKVPYPVGSSADVALPTGTIEMYRIIAPITSGAGVPAELTPDDDFGWVFRNMDGDHTLNQRFVYLVIIPTGSLATTKWDAVLIAENVNEC